MKENNELTDAVRRVYEINRNVVSLDPGFLADGAMEIIGFAQATHPVGWLGCHLHLRQLARAYCRRNFEAPADGAGERQGFLPLDALQDRYPRRPVPDQEPVYVLREHLTEDDRWFNIARLRQSAAALLRHADALQAETEQLFGSRAA